MGKIKARDFHHLHATNVRVIYNISEPWEKVIFGRGGYRWLPERQLLWATGRMQLRSGPRPAEDTGDVPSDNSPVKPE
jgi:hypothetical protein